MVEIKHKKQAVRKHKRFAQSMEIKSLGLLIPSSAAVAAVAVAAVGIIQSAAVAAAPAAPAPAPARVVAVAAADGAGADPGSGYHASTNCLPRQASMNKDNNNNNKDNNMVSNTEGDKKVRRRDCSMIDTTSSLSRRSAQSCTPSSTVGITITRYGRRIFRLTKLYYCKTS